MKPDKKTRPKAYAAWAKAQIKNWDPADDKGGPNTYAPRFDGVKALDIENQEETEQRVTEDH